MFIFNLIYLNYYRVRELFFKGLTSGPTVRHAYK